MPSFPSNNTGQTRARGRGAWLEEGMLGGGYTLLEYSNNVTGQKAVLVPAPVVAVWSRARISSLKMSSRRLGCSISKASSKACVPFRTRITTCYPYRVETGPFFRTRITTWCRSLSQARDQGPEPVRVPAGGLPLWLQGHGPQESADANCKSWRPLSFDLPPPCQSLHANITTTG